jgi:hypothetical protein
VRALQPTSVAFYEENYTLAKNVPAIQALMGHPEGDDAGLSLMTQLPAGAEIGIAGPGFNDRTVRVRCGGSWYYVFWDDLESQRKPAALAATL